jgi:hypothetical protein
MSVGVDDDQTIGSFLKLGREIEDGIWNMRTSS